jgi:glutamate-1-semialdehyde 2,1-aminomutase
VVVIPFNNASLARQILDTEKGNIACILLDPMPHRVGLIPAANDFVEMLRTWCDQNGALLVLDEVITFRSAYTGAGEWFPAKPDLTAMGKIIGGGFPVGAFGGRDDVMDLLDPQQQQIPFPHSGTFSANPITMTAGKVAMDLFDQAAVDQINDLGDYARASITEAIRESAIEACVTGAGSMFRIHMKPEPPVDYRSAYMNRVEQQQINQLVNHLFDSGFMMINTCTAALSTAMNREHVDLLVDSLSVGFQQLERSI